MILLYTVFEDYGSLSAAFFTFQPLITRNCITINIIDDIIDEDNEIFLVFLSIPSSTVTVSIGRPNQATVIIIDNDDAPPTSKKYSQYRHINKFTYWNHASALYYTIGGFLGNT